MLYILFSSSIDVLTFDYHLGGKLENTLLFFKVFRGLYNNTKYRSGTGMCN